LVEIKKVKNFYPEKPLITSLRPADGLIKLTFFANTPCAALRIPLLLWHDKGK